MTSRRGFLKGLAGVAAAIIVPKTLEENAEAARRFTVALDKTMVPRPYQLGDHLAKAIVKGLDQGIARGDVYLDENWSQLIARSDHTHEPYMTTVGAFEREMQPTHDQLRRLREGGKTFDRASWNIPDRMHRVHPINGHLEVDSIVDVSDTGYITSKGDNLIIEAGRIPDRLEMTLEYGGIYAKHEMTIKVARPGMEPIILYEGPGKSEFIVR